MSLRALQVPRVQLVEGSVAEAAERVGWEGAEENGDDISPWEKRPAERPEVGGVGWGGRPEYVGVRRQQGW